MQLHEKLGPLSTGTSDGAGHFRKGLGQLLSQDLPVSIHNIFKSLPLFNCTGGLLGMTISCDLDHLGKRFRARNKTAKGILVGRITFTKTELAFLLGAC